MFCTNCGQELSDSATMCQNCGTAVISDSTPAPDTTAPIPPPAPDTTIIPATTEESCNDDTAELPTTTTVAPPDIPQPINKTGKKRLLIPAIIILLLLFAWQHYFNQPLYSLVPAKSVMMISADSNWLWETSAGFRKTSDTRKSIADIEKEIGISFDKDVASCIGEVAISMHDSTSDYGMPSGAIYIKITNAKTAKKTMKKLQALLTKQNKLSWEAYKYKGATIQRAHYEGNEYDNANLSTTMLAGWFIIGYGDKMIETIIDANKGDTLSIKSDKEWQAVLKQLPKNSQVKFAVNGDSLLNFIARIDNDRAKGLLKSNLPSSRAIISLSDENEQLAIDIFAASTSKKTWQDLKEMRNSMGTIKGKSLQKIPANAFAAIIFNKPSILVNNAKAQMANTMGEYERKSYEETMAESQPMFNALEKLTGECNISANYNGAEGISISAVGEASNNKEANAIVTLLNSYLAKNGIETKQTGGTYHLKNEVSSDNIFPITPAWDTNNQWFRFASDGKLATSAERTTLKLPKDASKACWVMMANFAQLPAFISALEKDGTFTKEEVNNIRNMHLEKVELTASMIIAPNGKSAHANMTVQNFNLEKTIAGLSAM